MTSTGTFAIIALLLINLPARCQETDDLPQACANATSSIAGRPVMFPPHDGLSMGLSTPTPTFKVGDPVDIYVWVNNQTDSEKVLMSCSMWWDLGIAVYDAEWHEIKTQAELSLERVPGLIARKICGLNKTLRIPAHSCGPLQDSGDVKVNLGQERDMPVGNYFVTEKGQIRPQRGIRITIVNQELKH